MFKNKLDSTTKNTEQGTSKRFNTEIDFGRKKEYFNDYTMKKGWSIPVQVYLQLKDRKSYGDGLTCDALRTLVKSSINNYNKQHDIKPKKVGKSTIYRAISDLNKFCDHIYIRSDFHFIKQDKNIVKEYRYFSAYEAEERQKEKRSLNTRKLNVQYKEQGLMIFEEREIPYVHTIQELKIKGN